VILAIVLALLLAAAGLLWFRQDRMLYFPSRTIAATPADAGIPFEEVVFAAEDGVRLHGWFVPAQGARFTVLFCHGNGGNIGSLIETAAGFRDLGCNTLVFDYRGYGRSEGSPEEEGTYRDALAAWEMLTRERGVRAEEIIVAGRSLGGAVAAWLAARRRPAALVLEAAFTSVPDMAAELYPYLPTSLLSRFRYDTRAALGAVNGPVLVVHSPEDEVVPYHHGTQLFEAAPHPKRFIRITGGHNDGFSRSQTVYAEGWRSFIAELGNRPAQPPAP
jgi:hypothetical protein